MNELRFVLKDNHWVMSANMDEVSQGELVFLLGRLDQTKNLIIRALDQFDQTEEEFEYFKKRFGDDDA